MNQDPQAAKLTPPHTLRPWPLPRAQSPRLAELQRRLKSSEPASELVPEFLAGGTPVLEPGEEPGQVLVTFAWQGFAPYGVQLQSNRLNDILDPGDTLMEQVSGTDLHVLTLVLPDDWIGGYQFLVLPEPLRAPQLHSGADRTYLARLHAGLCADPHAREVAPGRRGALIQAVGRGPAASALRLDLGNETEWPSARISTTVPSPANATPLALHRWSHPSAHDSSPTFLFLDGEVWHRQYPILPRLIAETAAGNLLPMHALLLESGGPKQRQQDYLGSPEQIRRLLSGVLQAGGAGDRSPLIVCGQSLGGLFTMRATTFHPDLVAAGIAQSPSLWWPIGGQFRQHRGQWFRERAAAVAATRTGSAPIPSPLILHNGLLEWDLADDVRHAAALLEVEGSLIEHREYAGGHEVLWWQQALPQALAAATIHLNACQGPRPGRYWSHESLEDH